jgi:hypothetical protein
LCFNPNWLTHEKFTEFASIVHLNGAPLDLVAAMIDGTICKNACPVRNQWILYNGWKHMHCLKYHAVLAPDGIVIHIYGPVEGQQHNETVFQQSSLTAILDKHFWTPDRRALFIYGDSVYTISAHILCPYKGAAVMADVISVSEKAGRTEGRKDGRAGRTERPEVIPRSGSGTPTKLAQRRRRQKSDHGAMRRQSTLIFN